MGILIGMALKLYNALGSTAILTTLIFPFQEPGVIWNFLKIHYYGIMLLESYFVQGFISWSVH